MDTWVGNGYLQPRHFQQQISGANTFAYERTSESTWDSPQMCFFHSNGMLLTPGTTYDIYSTSPYNAEDLSSHSASPKYLTTPDQYPLSSPIVTQEALHVSIPHYSPPPPFSDGYDTQSTPNSNYSSGSSPVFFSDHASSSKMTTPTVEYSAHSAQLIGHVSPGTKVNAEASPSPAKKKSTRSRASDNSPYSRRQAVPSPDKKKTGRRIWNHALEKFLFTPHEIATLGAPNRRTIYLASLEAHIDRLHHQLLGMGLYPIPFEALTPYKGLNCKTAKSMVAALQFDIAAVHLNLFELERAKSSLQDAIAMRQSNHQLPSYPFSS